MVALHPHTRSMPRTGLFVVSTFILACSNTWSSKRLRLYSAPSSKTAGMKLAHKHVSTSRSTIREPCSYPV